ncbi:MAG: hypothetical protein KDD36_00265 [Flavobacteriales bacterium]|nr:hypothetical protein [Flavobacteriales bacterium]
MALTQASAQCYQTKDNGQKFGPDSAKCVENLSLYSEYYKQNNMEMAQKPWQEAITNCPRSSQNLYIHGPSILKYAIKKATDPKIQKKLVDSLMCVYDKRVEYFGKKGYVLGRKASDYYTLTRDSEGAYAMFKECMELEGNETEAIPLVYYFQSACDLLSKEKLTKEDVLGLFQSIGNVIDYNLKKDPNDKNYQAAQENVEKIFVNCSGIADCGAMIGIFGPQFDSKVDDLDWLKKVAGLLDRQKCQDSPLFFKVVDAIGKKERSATVFRMLAGLAAGKGDCTTAIKYLQDAVEMEEDATQKAKDLLSIAKCYANQKQFGQAKSYALRAASTKSGWGDPYISIAEWCAASSSSCGDNECLAKAGYWVAVDFLTKAKSVDGSVASEANEKISKYKQYFPNNEDCFFHGIKEGDEVEVGCWINEKTKARF